MIDENMFVYDLVAAPLSWNIEACGGGMSYRKKSTMIEICEKFKKPIDGEDCFFSDGVREMNYKMPDFETGITYICESLLYDDTMGVHQWWTYYLPKTMGLSLFINYLDLKIYE